VDDGINTPKVVGCAAIVKRNKFCFNRSSYGQVRAETKKLQIMDISTLKKMKTPNKVQPVSLNEEHYSKVKTGWSSQ
jgi:hypothetical protein